jgi:SAM-dependent methyltransferase
MAFAAALTAAGTPEPEVKRQLAVLMRLMRERSDWVEPFYDKVFSLPVTGDPETDGFGTEPSAILVRAVEHLSPGTALDAAMGQGRNAVFLATQGWSVTGFDLSAVAVGAAIANARRAGVSIRAMKASHGEFDFGTAKWDLIVLTFAWAPVDDATFVARLRTSLRPGGRIVFEHVVDDPEQPRPPAMHALGPGRLRELFTGFRMNRYEELTDLGDWGGPDLRLVRMVAVKPR